MRFILTSCGLSILTNFLFKKYKISPKEVYNYANMKEEELDNNFLKQIQTATDTLKNEILNYDDKKLKETSAELNALVTFYNNSFDKNDFHLLLYTDTYLGKQSADIIEYFLRNKGLQVNKLLARDLKTSSVEEFQISLSEIIKDLSEIIEGFKNQGYEIIFNLTGGFKGSNSFLQTMASLYADKSIYIFETAKELLTIPKLPIKIDETIFKDKLDIFRKLEIGFSVDTKEIQGIPKSIINQIDKEYMLSPWGEMVWQKYKRGIFSKILIKPIIEKIEFSKDFIKDFDKLNPTEKYHLNKSIEKLEKCILKNENLKSLRYHPLNGEISKKYTHEFYPFDGNDSRRVYCNEKNGKIILEKIDSHLK